MRKINTLFTAMLMLLALQMNAQEGRFLQEVFDEVQVTRDVVYGVNATILALPIVGEAIPEALKLDVYEPVGDEREERPLVMVFHTGNYLPVPDNAQILGRKIDSSVVEVCTRLARMGYTSAAVDYRLGWNPLAQTQPERALGLIQASYRSNQDGRAAVRFFKRDYVENGNTFKVDTSRIVAWGHGTGGYTTLGLATLDEYIEIIQTTNGPGKFLLDTDGDGAPETPMVVESVHGDLDNKQLTVNLTDEVLFGTYPPGDTMSMPNHIGYDSKLHMAVNVGGDLGDVSWIDENTVPIVTVQSAFDFFAPYDDAVLIVPTTGDPIVRVQGGIAVHRRLKEFGINDVFLNANIEDEFTETARINSAAAGHEYLDGLYPVTNPPNANGFDEGVTIEWWDSTAFSPPVEGFPNGLPWNVLPHPSGGSFHSQGLLTNIDMSAEKARTVIDTVMGYFAPRAFAALDLAAYTSTKEAFVEDIVISVEPNPAVDQTIIRTPKEQPIQKLELFDLNGRLLQSFDNVKSHYFFLHRRGLESGLYLAKIHLKEGIATEKILFK